MGACAPDSHPCNIYKTAKNTMAQYHRSSMHPFLIMQQHRSLAAFLLHHLCTVSHTAVYVSVQ